MEELCRYVLSVVSAALISGIVSGITSVKGTAGALIRMLCGLFLAFTIISPLAHVNDDILTAFYQDYTDAGEVAVAWGEELAADSLREIIKQETEAYILDKAAVLGAKLSVDVTVSAEDPPTPKEALLKGEVSSSLKQQLQEILESDLGIQKENQRWIN